MKKIYFIILALLVLAASCSCKPKERELPDNPSDPDKPLFQRYCQDMKFHSRILGEMMYYSVYLPADYTTNTDQRYSVVYMLHGYGDDNNSWNGKYLKANDKVNYLEATGMTPMIYVFPKGWNSYYSNSYDGSFKYMDMFVNELIPQIDNSLRTIADREHRAITGYSMGGFGAMVLPEKHPELFLCSAPLSMSFRTDAQYMTESQSGWNGQWGSIFGGYGQAGIARLTDYYKAHCPFYQFTAANRETLSKVYWYLTCGDDEEQLLFANDSLHVIMRDNGYEHEFRVADGAHTSSYWMDALNEVLPMFDFYMNKGGKAWEGINRELPTISEAEFAGDGTLATPAFVSAGTGTGLFFAYDAVDASYAKDIMSYLHQNASSSACIFLPCDLSQKSLDSWLELYEAKYDLSGKQALAVGTAGKSVFESEAAFVREYYIDASLPENIKVDTSGSYYFANTDNGTHYRDMAELYKACKRAGAKFEYRVIKGYPDRRSNILKSIQTIKTFINY